MEKKVIVACLIISIGFTGCAPAYKFVKYQSTDYGYRVRKSDVHMPYFTIDTAGVYPKDLKLAKKRFRNRRRIVEKYYRNINPEVFESYLKVPVKFLFFFCFFPISGMLMAHSENSSYERLEEFLENEDAGQRAKIEQYIKDESVE